MSATAALAQTAQRAGVTLEQLRELLDRDAQVVAGDKRQRLDAGSCSTELPSGWIEAKDPRYNNATYWYNRETRVTSWTRPVGGTPPMAPTSGQQHGGYAPQQQGGYGDGGYGGLPAQGGAQHGFQPPRTTGPWPAAIACTARKRLG